MEKKAVEENDWLDRNWLVVFGGFCVQIGAQGLVISASVLLVYFVEEFRESMSLTSFALNIPVVFQFISGIVFGGIGDRYGYRILAFGGSLLSVACLFIAAESTNLLMLSVFMGIMGCGTGMAGISANAIVPQWFKKKRSLAAGTMKSGAGIGQSMISFLSASVAARWGWRTALRVVACVVVLLVPLGGYVLRRPQSTISSQVARKSAALFDFSWFKKRNFRFWILFILFSMSGFAIPTIYTPRSGEDIGMPRANASALVLIIGLISALFRPILGYVSDKLKSSVLGMAVSSALIALSALIWMLALVFRVPFLMYIFAVLFGAGGAGLMANIFPVLADIFTTDRLGSVISLTYIPLSIAFLLFPPIAGWMFDRSASFISISLLTAILNLVSLPCLWMMHVCTKAKNDIVPVKEMSVVS